MNAVQPLRLAVLTRGHETGEIRMTMHGVMFVIGSYLPGIETTRPRGERVVQAEQITQCTHKQQADNFFDRYLSEAEAQGWRQP